MELLCSTLFGYLFGCFNPASLIARCKKVDLRTEGTGNLGGSNTMLVIGRAWGILVMLLDILKAFFAYKLAKWLFPRSTYAALTAGLSAVVGHVFPFNLRFKGGKGLASFGGLVLAYDPWMFLGLALFGLLLMILTNASVVMPLSAGTLFPVLVGIRSHDAIQILLCATACILIIVKHWSNIAKARSGNDLKMRSFFKNGLKAK